MKIICCNCGFGNNEEWEIFKNGEFICPNCEDVFINNNGQLKEKGFLKC